MKISVTHIYVWTSENFEQSNIPFTQIVTPCLEYTVLYQLGVQYENLANGKNMIFWTTTFCKVSIFVSFDR